MGGAEGRAFGVDDGARSAAGVAGGEGVAVRESAADFAARRAAYHFQARMPPKTRPAKMRRAAAKTAMGIHLGGEGMRDSGLGATSAACAPWARSYSPRSDSSSRPR